MTSDIKNNCKGERIGTHASLIGGSVCGIRVQDDTLIKYCRIGFEGVENGYHKLLNEAAFIKEMEKELPGLYPRVRFERKTQNLFEVGYDYLCSGYTFADVFRENLATERQIDELLKDIVSYLISRMYTHKMPLKPAEDYLDKFYFDRVERRILLTQEMCRNHTHYKQLADIISYGAWINGKFYPPVLQLLDDIKKNEQIIETLNIQYTTYSHHDLIPGNMLLELDEKVKPIKIVLIDPRGTGETGLNGRNAMYDMGKLTFGLGGYDLIRRNLHNGERFYTLDCLTTVDGILSYDFNFNENNQIVNKSFYARKQLINLLQSSTYCDPIGEESLHSKVLFSESTMFLSDIPCRIISENDSMMCTAFLLQGMVTLQEFYEFAKGLR